MPKNKALSWGIIGKSAPTLAEITIWKSRLLSRDRQSSEQFTGLNRRDDEMEAEFALVPLTISDTSQEVAL
jgi:hypothetical protein